MRDVIQKWYAWLKQATSSEKKELTYVYSNGRYLWATDGYCLHARRVATEKQGHVRLDENGLFQVDENGHFDKPNTIGQLSAGNLPDFNASLPQSEAITSIIVEREKLLQALTGQDRHVRLTLYADDQPVELSSVGAYALVMPLVGLEEEAFWKPELSD